MLVIRLSRTGRKKQPTYRVVVAEHSTPVKGRFIEVLGHYNPRTKDLVVDEERAKLRLSHGAKPSETAEALLEKAGVLERDKKTMIRRPQRQKRKEQPEEATAAPTPAAKADDGDAIAEPAAAEEAAGSTDTDVEASPDSPAAETPAAEAKSEEPATADKAPADDPAGSDATDSSGSDSNDPEPDKK